MKNIQTKYNQMMSLSKFAKDQQWMQTAKNPNLRQGKTTLNRKVKINVGNQHRRQGETTLDWTVEVDGRTEQGETTLDRTVEVDGRTQQAEATLNNAVEKTCGACSDLGTSQPKAHSCNHGQQWKKYESYVTRMQSFVGWPSKYYSQTPHSLASSGFFYIGSADRVTCFDCGITIRNWKRGVEPNLEHLRLSPDCQFIKSLMGNDLSQTSQTSHPQSGTQNGPCLTEFKSRPQSGTQIGPCLTEFKSNKTIQTVIEMGFSADDVAKVLTKNDKTDVASLVEAILSLEKKDVIKTGESSASAEGFKKRTNYVKNSDMVSNPDNETSKGADTEPTKVESLIVKTKKENLQLKKQWMCKKCGTEEAVMLCLPCGHISSCTKCIEKTDICFVCKAKISKTVRTYLA